MYLPIESLKRSALKLWNDTSFEYPVWRTTYSIRQQITKEQEMDCLMHSADDWAGEMKNGTNDRKKRLIKVRSRIQKSIIQFLHSFDCVIDDEMEESFSKVTDEFIQQAYDFDPTITEEAVYQASRNVLIMNTFQMHLGKMVTLTPSVFAYSMLYPYTDNYLDAVEIDQQSKQEANKRIQLRLNGITLTIRNRHEQMIDTLVGMIEGEFDRQKYPLVYESLLAIHNAQMRSVIQQGSGNKLTADTLLDISIEKGGTSVLADGYLVAGDLLNEDVEFLFRFGVLLQLIDDLQDIQEDCSRNQRTPVVEIAEQGFIDDFSNRLFSFIGSVVDPICGEQGRLHQLIDRSCRLLILEAISSHRSYYSNEYLHTMEQHSPMRFNYLRAMRKRLQESYKTHRAQRQGAYSRSFNFMKRRALEFSK